MVMAILWFRVKDKVRNGMEAGREEEQSLASLSCGQADFENGSCPPLTFRACASSLLSQNASLIQSLGRFTETG